MTIRAHPNRTVIKRRQIYITRPSFSSHRRIILLSLGSFTSKRAALAAIHRSGHKSYQMTKGEEIMMQPASFKMERER